MDTIRIQDDLYTYVNREKLESLVIPDDLPCVGGFTSLSVDIQKLMIGELKSMCESKAYPNEHLKRACTLFAAASDAAKKEADGIQPALNHLAVLDSVDSVDAMNGMLKTLLTERIPLPFALMTETDMKDTSRHSVFIQGPSVILPDASYYKPEMEAQKTAILGIWANMAKMILAKTPLSEKDQEQYLADTLAFDALLGATVKTSEEWSEYVKIYNPMKTARVATMLKPLSLKALLGELFGFVPESVIVTEPRYFKAFRSIFNEQTFVQYKHWAYVTALIDACPLLSEELREIGSMYHRAIAGIAAVTPIDKFAYELASEMYSEPMGVYYGEKYFGEEAKKDITAIVYQIIDTYKERIATNEILEESTKQKAITKLSKIGVKMGYPDRIDPFYNELVFDESASLYDIVMSLKKIRQAYRLAKLTKPVDRTTWEMPGHMVNACYNPFVNDITFPAAILQPPFYSLKQTRSENLGGIGAVIGHEISHAFDSNGAKCDENGNINNWWTKEDNRRFKAKIKAMIKQFDKIELPWGVVNGSFIVSENMADNGGMAVTLAIMAKTENASYEEYFKNWARVWCQKAKPEYQQLLLSLDVHGPAILRANMPPRNFPEWYTAFGVTCKDEMYIAPKKRVVIW
ncbi:MAG: M13 family peptidase [Clostridia bacterium]|nr:M13 family peptidase [Clostridia bacterium]